MYRYSTKRAIPLYKRRFRRETDFFAKLTKEVTSGLRPKPLNYEVLQWYKPPFTATTEVKQSIVRRNHVPEDDRLRYQYFYHLSKFVPAEHLSIVDDKLKPSSKFIKSVKKYMHSELLDEAAASKKAFADVRKTQADLNLQTYVAKQQAVLLNLTPYRATSEGGFVTDHDYSPHSAKKKKIEPLL